MQSDRALALAPLEPLHPLARLCVLAFLEVPDLGRWSASSRGAAEDTADDLVWADAYDRTRRVPALLREDVCALLARPFGDRGVGWRVAVFSASSNAFAKGVVMAYDRSKNAYLVKYDTDGNEVWELEARTGAAVRLQPNLASHNRIRFLEAPTLEKHVSDFQETAEPKSETLGNRLHSMLRFSSWRLELRNTAASTPSRLQQRIVDHKDEVLFVSFSPCGTRLATCSRDCTTGIYVAQDSGRLEWERMLPHGSAAVAAFWWPEHPHDRIAITTEGPSFPTVEVWCVKSGARLLQVPSARGDFYGSFIRWPLSTPTEYALLMSLPLRREEESFVQPVLLRRIPEDAKDRSAAPVLARFLLRGRFNYFHCIHPAPVGSSAEGCLAALTGGAKQCDAIAVIRLLGCSQVAASAETDASLVGVSPKARELEIETRVQSIPDRAVLSVRWAQGFCGRSLLLANTRLRLLPPPQGDTLEQLLYHPAPPLAAAIELLVIDVATLTTLSIHGGHHAFTTGEAPFVLHTDAWAEADILASGGEDQCVHLWHRRHNRQLQRLEGHSAPVNAVSWSTKHHVLASASDDHTVIIWACGADCQPSTVTVAEFPIT